MNKRRKIETSQSVRINRIANPCGETEDSHRPERRDAAENRQRILAAARQLFTERGVENVTMHQVAKVAGIGQGTLYRRYANKGELCIALVKASFVELCSQAENDLAQTVASMSRLEQLDSLLQQLVNFIEKQIPLLGAIEDAAIGHKRGMQFRNPLYQWMYQTIAKLLHEAIERGEILPLDTTYTADALLATLSIELYQFQRQERGFTPEQILQGIRWIYIERLKQS